MISIPWTLSKPYDYHIHGNYIFKRKMLKTYYYMIYEGEELRETTNDYFKVLRYYDAIVNGKRFVWGGL